MKLQIKTQLLQELVSKATKGAGNNKLIPITELIAIQVKEKQLTLVTTDATNYLYIKESNFIGDEFYVVIPIDVFAKLISKMTCENIILEIINNSLKVIGNGEYFIELPLNEDGEPIKYPDPIDRLDLQTEDVYKTTIHNSTAQAIINSIKPSLLTTTDIPCYTGYYMSDKVVATDTYKIAAMNIPLFDKPILLNSEVVDLIDVMTSEIIDVSILNNIIVFSDPSCIIYGTLMDCLEEYAIDDIMQLVNMEFKSICKVSKRTILEVLDRLALFVTTYDKNGVYFTFNTDGLLISSKSSSGTEIIPYLESKDFKPFTCCIDIEMIMSQIKAQASDVIEIQYGLDNAIKMVDGNIIQITALSEDDRFSEEN